MKGADPLIIAILMIVITVTAASFISGWATSLFQSQGQELKNQTTTKLACQMASFYVRNVSVACNYNCFTGSPYSLNASVENTGSQSISLSNIVITLSNGISHVLYGTPSALSAGSTTNQAFNAIQIWASPRMPVGTMDTRAAYKNDTNTTSLYHLDEGGTSAIADAGRNATGYVSSGLDGTLTGGPVWNVTGKYGNALSFDGVDDYVDAGNGNNIASITGDLTMSGWIYWLSSDTGNAEPISTHFGKNDFTRPYSIFLGGGSGSRVDFRMGNGVAQLVAIGSEISRDAWHHVAGTISGTTISIYVDGVLRGTETFTGTRQTGTKVTIGGEDAGGNRFFNGTIDEVQVWNTSLTGAQINQTMNGANPNNLSFENDLVAYYPFSKGVGAVAHSEEFWTSSGRFSSGVKLDGIDDYATANATLVSNDTGTVEAWANMEKNSPANDYAIFDTPSEVSSSDTGLVGLWHFSENSTAANGVKDSSPYGNNGTATNSPMFTNNGRFDKTWNFDGETDYVTIPNSASLGITTAVSMVAWIKPTNSSGYPIVKERDASHNGDYWINIGSRWSCSAAGGSTATTNASIEYGKWAHIVLTFQSNDLKCYVNGVLSGAVATTTSAPAGYNAPLLIGGGWPVGAPTNYFNGTIDEVAVYNRILTRQEIAAMYAGSLALHKLGENITFIAGNVTVGYNASALTGWHHVAGSYNSTTALLYVNGVLAGAVSRQKAVPMAPRAYIGGFNGSATFNGTIDEVRVSSFNRSFNVTLNINVTFSNIKYVRLFNATGLVNQSADQSGASSYYTRYENVTANTEFRVDVEDTSGKVITKWYPYDAGGICMPVSAIDRIRFATDNCPGVTDSYYGTDVYYEKCVV